MKTNILRYPAMFALSLLLISGSNGPKDDQFIIIGWNDLGMHCANKDFSKLVVLPPYNNLITHLIKKGDANTMPQVITTDFSVSYEIPGNTYSVGKTNFWDYEDQLFGVNLPDNIGLTGAGLTGEMEIRDNSFTIEGVPITPFTDNNLVTEDPFQLALIQAYDGSGNLLASTQNVIPVSNEINCVSSGCHSSEMDILNAHEDEGGFDPNNTPILCASCHSSNALGTPGTPGLGSLSEVIHDKHSEKTNDCYKCHPGPNTQCQRGVMHAAGMVCQDCHGSVAQVAQSIKDGREPWLEEPSCGAIECHGPQYAEEPGKLYRQSKGHGGLYCSTCHGSPHALVPSTLERDNIQNIGLQGYAGILRECEVCHGTTPSGPGPHGYSPQPSGEEEYVVLTWNDLGMHCANQDFSKIVVLPPYNNLIAQVIRKGDETSWPDVVTNGITLTYEIPGNTYSVGKTNFWDYEDQLFGVNLPDNIGLTGAGLTGEMEAIGNSFTIEGVPITPFTDDNLVTEDPFQMALIKAFDTNDNLLASTQNVIPVSNEIGCVSAGCHTSESNILNMHSDDGGFDPNNTPILCASCHSSNALGTPGTPGLGSLSEVIHDKHKDKTNNCYKCHPGSNTQCQRGVMHAAGMVCQDCHGDMEQVAESIKEGREPWLEEPSCGAVSCHGPQYAEEPGKLYRMSKGHGGLYCSSCHGSPHAIVPSTLDRDNIQNHSLQGYAGTLNNCAVCHGYIPQGAGPHGIMGPEVTEQNIQIAEGWSGISSYLIPLEQNVEDIFETVVNEMVILSNLNQIYWPEQAVNTIGNWQPQQGYVLKTSGEISIPFTGIKQADKIIPMAAGWNIMPVLSECNVQIDQLFSQHSDKLIMIKEVAGSNTYWPIYGISSLQLLAPGKAYFVLTNDAFEVSFPACN
nr:hypothetical protein [Bacteroidota bacterium]